MVKYNYNTPIRNAFLKIYLRDTSGFTKYPIFFQVTSKLNPVDGVSKAKRPVQKLAKKTGI